jgi:hypothetical protein
MIHLNDNPGALAGATGAKVVIEAAKLQDQDYPATAVEASDFATHDPDLAMAARFLTALDSTTTSFTFQTFDDNADLKRKNLAFVFHGSLDQHAGSLIALQRKGAGVFVTVNETDGKGRKTENVTRVRAFFLDLDGAPLGPVEDWEPPHIVCETSPGRWHTYWLVDNCPLDGFRQVQKDLIATFGGDDCIHDLPRVMRLPGFYHQKGNPYMVRMIETGAFPAPFKVAEFELNLELIKPERKLSERAMPSGALRIDTSGTGWADAALRGELSSLLAAPEGQRNAALNAAAFNLGQIVAGGGLNQATVTARLTAAAQGIGLGAGEIAGTIKSGLEAGLKQPRGPKEQPDRTRELMDDLNAIIPASDPVDLWGSFDPPELPQGLLPPVIEQFARANGDQMGADPAGLAVAALVTCAAAIPDAIKIKVKRHDDWHESARLWAALMGPPSAKKSPIISAATAPLCRLDVEMMRQWQKRVQEYDALAPDEKKGKQRPPQTRLRIEDATIEAAQQVLEGSPWGVLMLQDEMSGFFGAMDKYNGGKGASADRAFWLRSFNGGQFALNRVSRGAAIIDNLSVSMLGGIQPEPLRKIAGDAVDDGLLQRLFPIMLRNATMGRDEPMPPVNNRYRTLIESLRKLQPPGWMAQGVLEFDDGAQQVRRNLEAKHLELQSLETINRKLSSHIGKYDGLFARLCVIWHCVEHIENTMLCDTPDFEGEALPATVKEATAERVAEFLHSFLLAHSIAFYSGVLGLSDDHDRLTSIAGHILAHKLETVTNRDVQRGDRTMRGLKEYEIRPLLEQLGALGWLDRIDPPRPSSPPHWQVNPKVQQKFAERGQREEHRRKEARQTIRALVEGKHY